MDLLIKTVAFLGVLLLLAGLSLYRLFTVLNPHRAKAMRKAHNHAPAGTHLMIILGSGGHTAEMIAMLDRATSHSDLSQRLSWPSFTHRTWIVSSGDAISADRARQFEERAAKGFGAKEPKPDSSYDIHFVTRAREIHQPLYTTPMSALRCLYTCVALLCDYAAPAAASKGFPDLILCNGPATATIMILASILLRFFNVRQCQGKGKMRTIYVESWARVKKLSLSGTLLLHVVDRFLVQWPQLTTPGGKAEYLGVLV